MKTKPIAPRSAAIHIAATNTAFVREAKAPSIDDREGFIQPGRRVKTKKRETSKALHQAIDPAFQSALALRGVAPGLLISLDEKPTVFFADLVFQLKAETEKLKQGDLTAAKAALFGQAQVLQALFSSLIERSYTHFGSEHYQERILLALRVQNNCRKTLETLGRITNPCQPTVIQQNQVVMQGSDLEHHSAREINPATELLESSSYERMDIGTTGAAIEADSHLEAMAVRRRKNPAG